MKLPFEYMVARRYLRARRKSGFINLITYISIVGVAIGVAALIIVLAVMNGFESEVRDRIIGFDAHVQVKKFHSQPVEDYQQVIRDLSDIDEIAGMSPFILGKTMIKPLTNSANTNSGAMVRGVDEEGVQEITDLVGNLIDGDLNLRKVTTIEGKERYGIILGSYLADKLRLQVGQEAMLIDISQMRSRFSVPTSQVFLVTGIFETGFYEFDDSFCYISLEAAQELYKLGKSVHGVDIKLHDMKQAKTVKAKIQDRLDYRFFAQTWYERRQTLFSWMELERLAAFVILSLIILVAAFNIVSTLIMVVMEKTREIGILKSMGATDGAITRIFLYEGLVVGVMGTLIGFIVGFGICWAQLKFEFLKLPGEVYFIPAVPIKMVPFDFMAIGLASMVICLVSAIYPARRAAKLDPVEAIRYE